MTGMNAVLHCIIVVPPMFTMYCSLIFVQNIQIEKELGLHLRVYKFRWASRIPSLQLQALPLNIDIAINCIQSTRIGIL